MEIRKINVATILHQLDPAFRQLKNIWRSITGYDGNLFRRAKKPLKELIKEQIKTFGSVRRQLKRP